MNLEIKGLGLATLQHVNLSCEFKQLRWKQQVAQIIIFDLLSSLKIYFE